MIKNIDEFRMYALNHQHDIICVNETWLDNTVNNHEVELDGYDLVRKDRNRHGGGVAMFIRSTINYKIRSDMMPDMPVDVFTDYEILMQKMDHENKEIIGCLQKKVRLKNSLNWLTCFSLNNLLKNQHELLVKLER